MRTVAVLAGIAAGAALGLGGLGAIELATPDASAQGGNSIADLRQEVQGANFRSQAAINGYKKINNVVAKFFTEPNSLTGARSGPIPQDRGIGGGLPGSLIADGAVSESKLDDGLRAKVNAGGPPGPAGLAGPAGPVGPSDGNATSIAPATLPVRLAGLPPLMANPLTLETSIAGRLHVTGEFALEVACTGASKPVAWLEVDGDPVRSTYRVIAEGDSHSLSLTGVTENVLPPGAHAFRAIFGCDPLAAFALTTESELTVSVIVLG